MLRLSRLRLSKPVLGAAAVLALAIAVWAAIPAVAPKPALAASLPPGALMTLESPNFAALLHAWNASPEQTAWLASANYSAFTNSRLFTRLGDAQTEFESAAATTGGFGPDFLQQIAGHESIFAWYDISRLEFLYISHLPPGRAAKIELLQQRAKFSRRESGGTTFYLKTTGSSAPNAEDAVSGPSAPRTVAFALRGDWLVLATREDLIANALLLMQTPGASLAGEGWYTAAEAAAPPRHGDLHMLLDLQRIAATPAFRTYWVQRNVTETRQYRAAVVDLFREPNSFREERALLPLIASDPPLQPDLASLEALVPDRAGVYRVVAQPTPQAALNALDEKLLTRAITSTARDTSAPTPDLSAPDPGRASDLETRIDTVSAAPEAASAATAPLLQALASAGLIAILTVDRAEPRAAAAGLFIPIRSAVILRAANAWNAPELQAALLTTLRSHLTVGAVGLAWTPAPGGTLSLGPSSPFSLLVDGNTAILANDPALMADILARSTATAPSQPATYLAAFRHTQARPGYARLTSALAHTATGSSPGATGTPIPDFPGDSPDFFAGSVGSLSDAFRSLATERIVERRDGPLTHQTVTYTWQPK